MDNVTAHSTTNQTNQSGASYVDAYVPPAVSDSTVSVAPVQPSWSQPAPIAPVQTYTPPAYTQPTPTPTSSSYTPSVTPQVATVPVTNLEVSSSVMSASSPLASVSDTASDTDPATNTTTNSQAAGTAAGLTPDVSTENTSEELEDQNIFFMLGVTDGTQEQKEAFLDELQQVIWEDFLEFDVKLLITRDEQEVLNTMLAEEASKDLEKQEKVVVFLEKLVPDLEEIMLEKALELKEEMAHERVKGMREFYQDKTDVLAQLDTADGLMNVGKWHATATLLNSIR